MDRSPDLHKQIQHFFSKFDSSEQLGPLIGYSLKKQHQVIPGPAHFHQRTPSNVRCARLLERYDSDSFFSAQLVNRLGARESTGHAPLHGNAFLKMMEVLVTIFNIYLESDDSISPTSADRKVSDIKRLRSRRGHYSNVGKHETAKEDSPSMGDYSAIANNDTCKKRPARKPVGNVSLAEKGSRDRDTSGNTSKIVRSSEYEYFTEIDKKSSSSQGDNSQFQWSTHKKLKGGGLLYNPRTCYSKCARTLVWKQPNPGSDRV